MQLKQAIPLGLQHVLAMFVGNLTNAPQLIQLVFGGSGIVPAAVVAIILNIVLPKED